MELEHFVVKEEVQYQIISIEHISTNLIIVDPLTRGLSSKIFSDHVERTGIMTYNY